MKKNHVRKYMRLGEKRRVWKKAVSILSCIVVFVTTYMLLLPAITMEKTAICGIEAHQHDESCWETETKLTCGLDEEDGHQHTDDCFTTTRKLICTLEQHTHSEQCYNTKGQPSCALEEHSHTDECFREDRFLLCPLEETADHQHTEDCYKYEKVLICGKEAHTHTPECFGEDTSELSSGAEDTEAVEEGFNETVDAEGDYDSETESGEGLTYENTRDTEQGTPAETSTPDESISDENGTENIFDESGDEAAGMTNSETDEFSGDNEEIETGTGDTEILNPSDGSEGFDGSDEDEASDSETADPSLESGEDDSETGENSDENETVDTEACENSGENETVDAETGENSGENETSDVETAENSSENETSDAETGENSGENETSDAETAESSEENGTSDAETADSTAENGTEDAGEAASSEETESTEAAAEASGEGIESTQAASESASGTASGTTSGEAKPGLSKTLTFEGPDYTVTASFDENAGIPSGASLSVEEITQDQDNYKKYSEQAEKAVGEEIEGKAAWVRLFDITIVKDGQTIEPTGPVSVQINYHEAMERPKNAEVKAVHFEGEKETPVVLDTKAQGEETSVEQVSFDTESFSVFAIVGTTIEKTVLASDGKNYKITVTYGPEAEIPEGAELAVEEILPDEKNSSEDDSATTSVYEEYVSKTENALGMEEGTAGYIRLFDISIVDKDNPEKKHQPAEGSSATVRIDLADSSSDRLNVVHFPDGSEEGEKVQNSTENGENGSIVEFQADGFSVYSIVDAPEPVPVYENVSTLADIVENQAYYLAIARSGTNYMTSTRVENGAVFELAGDTNRAAGENWFFEFPEEGKVSIYYLDPDNNKMYLNVDNYTNISFSENPQALSIEPTTNAAGTFYIYTVINNKNYALSVRRIRNFFFENRNNGVNANERVVLTKYMNDPYKLNGKSFGIAYHDDSTTAAAMTAEKVDNQSRLEGVDMLMRADVLSNKGILLVAENSDIQEWTFESAGEDKYYIKTTVDGTEKYLRINGGSVTLVDGKASASAITATPGTDENSGKWHFTFNNYSLSYAGSSANNFNAANNNNATTWLNLVEKSPLSEDDFVEYTARKISASDDILSATKKDEHGEIEYDDQGNPVYKEKKAKVVIYTRVWNDTTKKYEFYAVDHDGSLVRVYDSGDQIIWVGNQVNSALWEFTEYTNQDGNPTYFYELENTAYAGKYLAPQSESIISDQPIGINLNGRREGYDYTSIVAWDDPAYAYSGLKIVQNEDGSLRVVTCSLDEADDFHFAVITPPVEEADPTTEVDTVDNDDFGISIKMIDFNNRIDSNNRDVIQRAYLGYHTWDAAHAYEAETGLVSTNLENGYPRIAADTVMHGESLSGLFDKTKMTPANHLFIQSVYNESGYFEYDSTQNFAHLNTERDAEENPEKRVGDFTVYNQLGAIGTFTTPTRVHGQFMPFNDISKETGYAHDTSGNVIRNLRDIAGQELPDSDPRKGEPLYSIPQNEADYYFGMELSAVFTQTPDGVDNWGHDIIFEFTGDDDFWFYVDGELVLDLGGVHSAIGGSVNFRTGEVVCNGTVTSLYEVFKQNYAARRLDVSKVDDLFVTKIVNGEMVHVFNDYTTHEMKMFYMERGAGASNLRMRFNLASVKPGTVELSKKLKGTDNTSNKLIQYPYQIWYQTVEYRKNEDGTYALDNDGNRIIESYNQPVLLEQPPKNTNLTGKVYAVYKGTKKLIPFKKHMKIGGFTYDNVFLLKAGETAVINFPENTYRYKLVECGVDTAVYEHVYINGAESGNEIFGKPHNNGDGWEFDPETGEEILPTQTATYDGTTRSDFGITYNTTEGRPRVEYTNEVPPDVMRTLSIKKVLYDAEGNLLSDADAAALKAEFNFRLYLGNEFAEQENLAPADMYTYYVKGPGPNSEYCKWDKANQEFVPLGVSTFDAFKNLSEDDQRAGTFTTSIYGAISKIPAGYTIEVRDLIVGTKYKVEEPDREIPKGYTRCDGDGYVRTDLEPDYVYYTDDQGVYERHPYPEEGDAHTAEPISDTIASKTETPQIEIRNQEGWGLTAQKEWTDKDFMIHDPIYLAIYLKGDQGEGQGDGQGEGQGEGQGTGQGEGQGTGQGEGQDNLGDLVEGTVRRLNIGETEVYWFFQDLKIGGEPHSFGEFIVREVILTDPVVDENGVVTSYSSITPVGEGQSINVSGRTYGGTERTESYTVNYVTGKSSGKNENIRTDTVKNSRPGIQIYKTNWGGDKYLSGAVFTLKDSDGHDVGHATYTSDRNGLVTTAYLNEGTFTLNEIRTPTGYVALDQPITIIVTTQQPTSYDLTVTSGGTTYYIVLSGPEGFYTTTPATGTDMARITVKNRTVQELTVVKVGVDGNTRTPLSGVHFALYEQVRDSEGNVRPAYTPMDGYDDLVTKDNGLLEEITMNLGRGTYYLREKEAPSGYSMLPEDLCFTIGGDGTVSIHNSGYSDWLTKDTSVPGTVSYQISIVNTSVGITVRKTDESGNALAGSQFVLYKKNDTGSFVIVTGYGLGENGLIDLTDTTEMTLAGMASGIYKLSETNAPPGYIILTKDIYFNVANGTVTLTDENGDAKTYSDVSLLDNNTTIAVKNNIGASLPSTGGPGTTLFYLLGTILTAFAGAGLVVRKRRKT